ncbi:hypothetical protein I302_100361 [Kwoniella bestiolae CBS 10118]|uniref:Uncharacterized protein n=1 Tax=Kwoniella bestiolae CBS 10118 TaxID=1296100 RepID=A0A1B9G4Y2_9TREE|nr:hypothetical protein I302_03735 [Kwoniella bestiolae CBS 10118]OCF26058.1 hypothetical protein I302_03735 [Kwoniella bestiolae CBS 10118]
MPSPPAIAIATPIPPILLWSTHRSKDTIIRHSCSQAIVHVPMEDDTLGRWLEYCDAIYNTTEPELGFEPKYKAQIARFKYKLLSSSSIEEREEDSSAYIPVSVDQIHLMRNTAGLKNLQGELANHGRQISKTEEGILEMDGRVRVIEHKIQQQSINAQQSSLSRQSGRPDSWSICTTSDQQTAEMEDDESDEEWDKLSVSPHSNSVDLPVTQSTQETTEQCLAVQEDSLHPTPDVEAFASDAFGSDQEQYQYPNLSRTLSDMGWILQNYHEAFIRVSQDMEGLRTSLKELAVRNTWDPTDLMLKIDRLESESEAHFANDFLANERLNEVDRSLRDYEGLEAKIDEQHYEINRIALRVGDGIEPEAKSTECEGTVELEVGDPRSVIVLERDWGDLIGNIVGSRDNVDNPEELVMGDAKDQGSGTSLGNDPKEVITNDADIPQDHAITDAQNEERLSDLEKSHLGLCQTVLAFRKRVRRRTVNMGYKLAQINDEFHIPNIHMKTSIGTDTLPQLTTRKISQLSKSELDDWLDFYDIPQKHLTTPRRKRIALYAFLGGVPGADTFSGES